MGTVITLPRSRAFTRQDLEAMPDDVHGPGRDAFLALALHDAGRPTEALAVALRRLAPTLPEYGRAVAAYADELTERDGTDPAAG